jgi:hypothetical protein
VNEAWDEAWSGYFGWMHKIWYDHAAQRTRTLSTTGRFG